MPRLVDISISTKVALAFLAMLVAGVAMIATVTIEIASFRAALARNARSTEIVRLSHVAELGILRMNSQMRGMLLTGNLRYADTYFDGRRQFYGSVPALLALPLDPVQRALILRVRQDGALWESRFATPMMRASRTPALRAAATRRLIAISDKVRVTFITSKFQRTRAIEEARVRARDAQQRQGMMHSILVLAGGAFGLLGIAGAMAVLLHRLVARPVRDMAEVMRRLAEGDDDPATPAMARGDEIGQMAEAVAVFRANAAAKRRLEAEAGAQQIARQAEREQASALARRLADEDRQTLSVVGDALGAMAAGDLTARLAGRLPRRSLPLERNFDAAVEKLSVALAGARGAAATVDRSAGALASASEALSRRTDGQAVQLTAMARMMQGLSNSVGDNAGRARRVADVAGTTQRNLARSGDTIGATVSAMERIEAHAGEVQATVDLITTISQQTSLLALNAMLEASRHGAAGSAFSVVAHEVRDLADRTKVAAGEIAQRLDQSSAEVLAGARLARGSHAVLDGMIQQVGEISVLTADIASAMQHQAEEVRAADSVAKQIEGSTRENADMAVGSQAFSRTLAQDAEALSRLLGAFRTA